MSIKNDLQTALEELLKAADDTKGKILVVGCSTSEVLEKKIGTGGSLALAEEIFSAIKEITDKKGMYLACQCCEHLNRAIVVEKECLDKYSLCQVMAVPHEHAGGSFATAAYRNFENPSLAETIAADYGIDIGDTLIGMHLKRVAVPVRVSIKKIGEANLVLAKTRPKYIGGPRAQYE